MAKCSTVVIGANFGDEGKGLITDFETRHQDADLVVRFNGGAQAGHTVVNPQGRRHVFSHVSAGTFTGAKTYLGSKFIVNPLLLAQEIEKLKKQGILVPEVYVHPQALVSTIYDMVLNSLAELKRTNRHGSCGLGINETVTRHLAGYKLTANDVLTWGFGKLKGWFFDLDTFWVYERYLQNGCSDSDPETDERRPLMHILRDHNEQQHATNLLAAAQNLKLGIPEFNTAVFEGAQGLALDEHLGTFPHVTRSLTGLPQAIHTAVELGVETLQPLYVTRCYMTRHGAGPLEYEGHPFSGGMTSAEDSTNKPNMWQGSLRFAPLNLKQMKSFIEQDMDRAELLAVAQGVNLVVPGLAVTCLDQVGDTTNLVDLNGKLVTVATQNVANFIADKLEIPLTHVSYGPTADDVKLV